jgi:hypothetical protein
MKTNLKLLLGLAFGAGLAVSWTNAARPQTTMAGDYLEVRSCDIYTGSCIANSEMNLTGREGMLVWSVRQGGWKGTRLDGLTVIAVLRTDDTLGDVQHQPRDGQAVVLVDQKADHYQQKALVDFAQAMGGSLVKNVAAVKLAPIESAMGTCASGSCAKVTARPWVEISTRCLGGKDHLCGNEENFYPPLTSVKNPLSVFTEIASFNGPDLNVTWEMAGKRSAYVATFEVNQ